jgi:hypothetical protein
MFICLVTNSFENIGESKQGYLDEVGKTKEETSCVYCYMARVMLLHIISTHLLLFSIELSYNIYWKNWSSVIV